MSDAVISPVTPQYAGNPLVREGGRRVGGDALLSFFAHASAVVVLLMLVALVVVLAVAAIPSIQRFGVRFLVTSDWRPNPLEVPQVDANGDPVIVDGETQTKEIPPAFGALPVIYGTAVSSLIALVLAVPLSFGAALFLIRIAPRALAGPVSFLIEFLAAIPSIAYGIWGLFVLGPFLQSHLEPAIHDLYLNHLPDAGWIQILWGVSAVILGTGLTLLMSRWASGKSVGLTLFAVATPIILIIIALSVDGPASRAINRASPSLEQSLRGTWGYPPNLRWMFHEKIDTGSAIIDRPLPMTGRDMLCGSLVLAVMILPIITAISRDVLRSVPRAQVEATVALGATWWQSSWQMLRYSRSGLFGAVMLGLARAAGETMAVTMVIGNNNQIRASVFAAAQTMSSLLANEFAEASTPIHRAALTEVALVLLLMSLLFNVIARYLVVGRNSGSAAGQ